MSEKEKEAPKTVEKAAAWAVDAFDQANTNAAIESLGSRGKILSEAINDLRRLLNKKKQITILNDKDIEEIVAARRAAGIILDNG